MKKHIIIEGPDCCGKSYLIRSLLSYKEFSNYEVEHLSGICPNTKEFHEDLLDYDRPMIFDRFFVGETVYPFIFNREPRMTVDDMIDLCKKYKDRIIIVFMDADYDFIIRAHDKKHEDFVYEDIRKAKEYFYDRYEKLNSIEGLKVFRFKNYKENTEEFNKFIQSLLKEVRQ